MKFPKPKSRSQFKVHETMAVKWKRNVRSWIHWSENTAVRRLSFLKFSSEVSGSFTEQRSHQTTTKPNQNEVKCTMAIYPKCIKQLRGVLWKNTCSHTCTYEVWNYFSTHVQYEVRQLCRRDTWSQATWDVSEVLPLWCTSSSHRRDSKYQPLSWLKQHPKQQVLG